MTDTDHAPSWLDQPCPPWCEQEHHDDDHPDDRVHRGASQHTSLAVGRPPRDRPELAVTFAEQRPGGPVLVHVALAEGPLDLLMSDEGAARLCRALALTLQSLEEVSPEAPGCPPSSGGGSP